MSRVDEAMRRAGAAVPEDRDLELPDGSEPYPIEMPDRLRPAVQQETLPPAVSERFVDLIPEVGNGNGDRKTPVEPPPVSRLVDRFHPRVTEKVVIDRRMPAACREQYRRLAAVLHDAQTTNRMQVVMVASAVAGEGKTLTAANIALTLSSSYRKRVLIIDGDLRRPVMHQLFRMDTASGLADGLDPAGDMKIVIRQVTPTLALLPAGRPTNDPMAVLISERMRQLIEEARQNFDWIIIDTPPLVLLPDAHLLASIADAALLVVKAESTPHALVKRATDAIGRGRVLGVVLNNAPISSHQSYGSYGDYYSATIETEGA